MRSVHLRGRRTLVAGLVALLLAVAGCTPPGPSEEDTAPVSVTGSFGSVPAVTFEAPLPMQESEIETVSAGDGRELAPEEPVLFALTAYDGDTGKLLADRGAGIPRTLMLTREDVGQDLYPVLVGTREGTRLLLRQPVTEDGEDRMLVLVIDVLHTRARGEELTRPADAAHLPDVTLAADGTPSITVPEGPPPEKLVVAPRIRGTGPQVRPGQDVTVQYTGVVWETGEVYDSTWESGKVPQTVPLPETFPGLRDGLVDQPIGSQLVLVVPPNLAVGTGTLIMVVDVLAASGGEDDDVVVPNGG